MYEALAMAIEMNNGSDADVKKSLDYAADLAQKTHNPNHLVSVADRLFLKGYFERVGALLDEAMPKIPHRFEPIVMSINLAQKTKDPVRMADSVERLLSLGWPGRDEYFRIEAGNQVDQLVKQLRADEQGGRGRPAPEEAGRIDVARRVRPADLGRLRRFRPFRRRAIRGDGEIRHAAHRLRRSIDQERLRSSPGRDLCLPARLQRQVHDSRLQHLHRSQATRHSVDARSDHPRGDRTREERDPESQA